MGQGFFSSIVIPRNCKFYCMKYEHQRADMAHIDPVKWKTWGIGPYHMGQYLKFFI